MMTSAKLDEDFETLVKTTVFRVPGTIEKARDLSSPPSAAAKPGWLSSVVKVKEGSPLANWVKRHISSEGIDFKLVEDGDFNPSDLRQVSMKGQVKIGNKGYYGHGRQASDFIGFADKRYLTERRREHGEALMAEKEALESLGRIRAEQEAEGRKAGLYDTLKTVEWDEVACAAVEIEIERLKTEINGLEKSNLSQLERRMEAAKEGHDKEVRANQDLKRRQKENEESEKELNAKISSIEGSLTMHRILPTVQEPLLELFERSLDHVFGLNCPTESQRGASIIESGYNDLLKKSENEIVDSLKHKADDMKTAKKRLEKRLFDFKNDYSSVIAKETGTEAEDAPAYIEKLDRGAVAAEEDRFAWILEIVNELVNFYKLDSDYRGECRNSFEAINAILSGKRFNEQGDVLHVEARFRDDDPRWRDWDRRAKDLIREYRLMKPSEFESKPEPEQIEAFKEVIECALALSTGASEKPTVLTDPRERFRAIIEAVTPQGSGRLPEDLNSTSGMNGGKKEKISAFVLAAAIYCSLGMKTGDVLPYAPLLIDEAFIKSDAETTEMSLEALMEFGFQLIVVTPEEKFQTAMDLSDRFYYVTREDDEAPSALSAMADNVTGA